MQIDAGVSYVGCVSLRTLLHVRFIIAKRLYETLLLMLINMHVIYKEKREQEILLLILRNIHEYVCNS